MSRSIIDVEAEIKAIKDANPNWITNAVDKALVTELMKERNNMSGLPHLL